VEKDKFCMNNFRKGIFLLAKKAIGEISCTVPQKKSLHRFVARLLLINLLRPLIMPLSRCSFAKCKSRSL